MNIRRYWLLLFLSTHLLGSKALGADDPFLFIDYSGFHSRVDYLQLAARLGDALPDGSRPLPGGLPLRAVAIEPQIEGEQFGYMPQLFTTGTPPLPLPPLEGKTAIDLTNTPGGTTTHATVIAFHLMGNGISLSSGINELEVNFLPNWVYKDNLHPNSNQEPAPVVQPIISNSWAVNNAKSFEDAVTTYLGGTPDPTRTREAIREDITRRIDYISQRDGVFFVVGLTNNYNPDIDGPSLYSPHSDLIGQAYNTLTVGLSNGWHTRGFTTFSPAASASYNGGLIPGRQKPDIVVLPDFPIGSFGIPVVSTAALLLYDTANDLTTAQPVARRPETLKAILMAGATKHEFENWEDGDDVFLDLDPDEANYDFQPVRVSPANPSFPLHPVYGVGELNIDHSHRILTAGRQAPNLPAVAATGWDFGQIAEDEKTYRFEVPDRHFNRVSIVLTWQRKVYDGDPGPDFGNLQVSFSDLDLALHRLDSPGDELTADNLVAASLSRVDNVEHIYLRDAQPGYYVLRVVRTAGDPVDYALAWRTTSLELDGIKTVLAPGLATLDCTGTQTDYSYTLQSSLDLQDWQDGETYQGIGPTFNLSIPLPNQTAPLRFYRLRPNQENAQFIPVTPTPSP